MGIAAHTEQQLGEHVTAPGVLSHNQNAWRSGEVLAGHHYSHLPDSVGRETWQQYRPAELKGS
jgi:hypothetical protein